jgi:hypothetical protein
MIQRSKPIRRTVMKNRSIRRNPLGLPYGITKDGREICRKTPLGRALYRQRTLAMAFRQKWRCALCGKPMSEDDVTFDHQDGRGMGGSRRDDRIEIDGKRFNAAAHEKCNGEKGSRRVPYLLQ